MVRAAALLVVLTACSNDPIPQVFTAEVVLADGSNPLAAGDVTRVVIVTRQGEAAPVTTVDEDGSDGFDLRLPIDDREARIDATVTLERGASLPPLIGAPAPFRPGETDGFLRIVVVPASSCAV